jgi:hypothetical protein
MRARAVPAGCSGEPCLPSTTRTDAPCSLAGGAANSPARHYPTPPASGLAPRTDHGTARAGRALPVRNTCAPCGAWILLATLHACWHSSTRTARAGPRRPGATCSWGSRRSSGSPCSFSLRRTPSLPTSTTSGGRARHGKGGALDELSNRRRRLHLLRQARPHTGSRTATALRRTNDVATVDPGLTTGKTIRVPRGFRWTAAHARFLNAARTCAMVARKSSKVPVRNQSRWEHTC